MSELIQPTEGEAKNGWTAETLTQYLEDRHREEDENFHEKKPKRQTRTIYRKPRR